MLTEVSMVCNVIVTNCAPTLLRLRTCSIQYVMQACWNITDSSVRVSLKRAPRTPKSVCVTLPQTDQNVNQGVWNLPLSWPSV